MQGFEAMLKMMGVDATTLETKMRDMVEGIVSQIVRRFDHIDTRLASIDVRLEQLGKPPETTEPAEQQALGLDVEETTEPAELEALGLAVEETPNVNVSQTGE